MVDLARIWFADENAVVREKADAVQAYRQDPLYFHTATARFATEVFAASERVQSRAADLAVPLLILHGTGDRQARPEASRRVFERVRSADKELHLYPGAYHALDWEPNREEVFADCVQWLERHLPEAALAPTPG